MKTITGTFKEQRWHNSSKAWYLGTGYIVTCDLCGKETYPHNIAKADMMVSSSCSCERHRTEHPLYATWNNMKQRCNNVTSADYNNYGGRGISVCDSWNHDFTAFINDMGPRPEGMSLDRIDNDGNYEPGNCRWATREQQNNNTRRNKKHD